jgi:hypothetical protein
MAQFSFAIVKRCAFRDSVQEFSNVYTYRVTVPPNDAELANRIAELVAFEKTIHSTQVTFLAGRCWSSGGSISSNVMRVQTVESGTGVTVNIAHLDRERAVLVQWPAGTDSRGKQVYLRKWWHPCGAFPGVTWSDPELANTQAMSSTERTAIAAKADEISNIGATNEYVLCSMAGREFVSGPEAHPYFEHHQMGDMWRG